jgi:diacylglycerol kinase
VTNSRDEYADRPTGFSWRRRLASFAPALRGIAITLRTQHNAWIHAVATLGVVAAGILLDVSRIEWGVLLLAMALVWSAEAFNTALEALGDAISPGLHPLVGSAKDVAAGAVLASAIGALGVGVLVFGPRLAALVGGLR